MKSVTHIGVHPHPSAFGVPQGIPAGGSEARAAKVASGRQSAPSEARQVVGDEIPLGTSLIELPPVSSGLSSDLRRRTRLMRRQKSSAWLIGQARLDAGFLFNAEPGTTAKDPEWVRPRRAARCRWRVAPTVGVHGSPKGTAHFSGTERCASIWACPVCSPVIRAGRSKDIASAVEEHRNQGGKFLFLTLTLRHRSEDPLDLTLNAALKAWTKLIAGSPWQRQQERLGIRGYVRAVEITRGQNGWHPHVHALIFLEESPSEKVLADFEDWISSRWAQKVVDLGARMPSKERGVDLRRADDATSIALYLSKVQEKKISDEMARSDFKTGRSGSFNPFDLLDSPIQDSVARALWIEYVAATHGRRAITWSRGLRKELTLEEELTDEQIIEDTDANEVIAMIDAETWDRRKNSPSWLALLLEEAELPTPQLLPIIHSVEIEGTFIDPLTGELLGHCHTGASPLIAEQI